MGEAASFAALEPGELRARRVALGLTQAELADGLGVTANTVARWERGEQRIGRPRSIGRILQRLEQRQLAASGHAGTDARWGRRRQCDQTVGNAGRGAPGLVPHNLPAELSSFIGRAEDIDKLVQRLGSARLITLVGSAGVGKTRLALQVARRTLDLFSNGVCLVPALLEGSPDRRGVRAPGCRRPAPRLAKRRPAVGDRARGGRLRHAVHMKERIHRGEHCLKRDRLVRPDGAARVTARKPARAVFS